MSESDPKTALTRRGFVRGVAAGAGAVATAPLVAACAPSEPSERWDRETDFVVIGSGTGLAGALTAARAGAEVLVLEKAARVGGNTAMSGGVAWIPNNSKMAAEGISDSRERALTYLTQLSQQQADPELVEAFLDNAPRMADFIEANSSIEWRVSQIMGAVADYHPEWQGAVRRGRSIEPTVDTPGMYGGILVQSLREAVEAAGGEILLETPARRLIAREGAAGAREVIGVQAERAGAPLRIKARRGVLLSAGGFEWNFDMKRHFLRGPSLYPLGASSNTGDGVRMAMQLGADLRNMNELWGISVYTGEADAGRPHGIGPSLSAQIEIQAAGSIVVNRHGERFMNESSDYDSSWRSYFGWENYGALEYRNLPAFAIYDARVRQERTIAGRAAGQPLPAWVHEAASPQELASQLGIDPSGLERELAAFNAAARQGRDPVFHRGESYYDRRGAADPAVALAPVEEPPFYGAQIGAGDLGTCGGPRVNRHAQVLNTFGDAIGRLYASGNNAGVGSPGSSYGGGGGTIGPALTFAFLAGEHAAGLAAWSG